MRRSLTPLQVAVRVDFVLAVLITVLLPLALLLRAVVKQQAQLAALLSYWRSSSLLMVAVYLLAAERRSGFVAGVAARLLIPWTVRRARVDDELFDAWRRLVSAYCLAGATITLPTLWLAFTEPEWHPLCRAYLEPPQQYAAVLHRDVPRERLGRAGEIGLLLFLLGAAAFWRPRQGR